MSLLRSAVAAIVALAVSATVAQATPVSITAFSNPFGQVATTNTTISGSNWFATGFNTGTSPDFLSLTSVKLSIANSGTLPSSNPIIKLFTGPGIDPATEIATLTGNSISSGSPVTATFTPSSSPLALSPNTNYWVVLSAVAGDQYGWYTTDENPSAQNGSGFSFVSGRRSTNAGSTWSNSVTAGVAAVSVEVLAVPEPPAIMLAGLGVVGVVVADRTRRLRRARATTSGDDTAEDSNLDG